MLYGTTYAFIFLVGSIHIHSVLKVRMLQNHRLTHARHAHVHFSVSSRCSTLRIALVGTAQKPRLSELPNSRMHFVKVLLTSLLAERSFIAPTRKCARVVSRRTRLHRNRQ